MFGSRSLFFCACFLVFANLALRAVVAQAPQNSGAPVALSAEERKSLDEQRNRLWTDAHALDVNQKPADALTKLQELLPPTIRAVGEKHDEVAQVLAYVAELQSALGALDAAKETRAKVLQMKTDLYGDLQSDSQQIVLQQYSHEALDSFLQTAIKTNTDPEEISRCRRLGDFNRAGRRLGVFALVGAPRSVAGHVLDGRNDNFHPAGPSNVARIAIESKK
jgi:hypothetical protein